ncbi:methyl-accepting chemotaxis protein [Candidatus Magnetomorum sp. HK-1]|nr:methyl-accepting chemotaxis protein [Candidatus Magnetomorum sp. HK-1]
MKLSFTIVQKIWMSLGILIAGYFLTMLLGFIHGFQTESHLNKISNKLLPIATQSKSTLLIFNEQIKLYNLAASTGEISLVDSAQKCSLDVLKSLQNILTFHKFNREKNYQINQIINDYKRFNTESQNVYSIISKSKKGSDKHNKDISDRAFILEQKTKKLKDRINKISVAYSDDLSREFNTIIKYNNQQRYINLFVFIIVVSGCITAIYIIITRSITSPLNNVTSMLKDIAEGEGNLTTRLPVENPDEIGELAKWFNNFLIRLQSIIKQITENAIVLNRSSGHLSEFSGEMIYGMKQLIDHSENASEAIHQLHENINSIASSAEQMSANINNVSNAAEHIANNMNKVTSSTEDMSHSINSIGKNIQEGQKISADAMELANIASENMNLLGTAAREIGQVTVAIKRIAVQTNLLALNASIEASTAGEAGRGFSVVAEKIKQFASQSTQSAENISKKIEDMQSKTENAISVIENVTDIIGKINQSSSYITGTVENQMKTSSDISIKLSEVNNGTNTIATSISESALGVQEMSKNTGYAALKTKDFTETIEQMRDLAESSNKSAKKVQSSAVELTELAVQLNKMVNTFII